MMPRRHGSVVDGERMTVVQPQAAGGRKAEVSAETRAALLEAGAGLLREVPVGAVLSQLTARAVAERAGRTTGAFFHHWRNQEAYQRDLLAHILDPARIESTAEAVDAILGGLQSGADPVGVLGAAARGNFASVRVDPYVPLWNALWSRHGADPYVHELLRRNFASVTAQVAPVLEAVLAASGRRMRPPHTVDTLAVTVTALVQGLALRVAIEPERVPVGGTGQDDGSWDLFATTVTTLFDAVTTRTGA
jgi:AcrR family transcriptional regulator